MLLAEAGCLLTCFILYTSGVQGQANKVCALKGSSVDLPCSAQHPTSNMTWYTVNKYGSVQNDLFDGNFTRYNMSAGSNFTLTIKDLRENDTNVYCCGHKTDNPRACSFHRTELRVADLQVKVIPATEGQTVTLMCSTSCPLTENPAAYIWYKNREFLYQDWSPWYQQLVSSEEAVRYSCAIKGYEDLRAPEVSVDSVTPSCFNVTYAEGRMCSFYQMSSDEPCSITYPTEVHVQRTPLSNGYVRLSCTSSCPLTDPQTAYRWYRENRLYRFSENQNLTVHNLGEMYYCAIKGHEDLQAAAVCPSHNSCWTVNFVSRRICALKGSSVNISSQYSYPKKWPAKSKSWYAAKRRSEEEAENLTVNEGRLEYHDNMKDNHILNIKNLRKKDSAEYIFRFNKGKGWASSPDSPGVTLVVTGLEVKFTPSAVVTEGQRVTVTCSTSCPLTHNTNFIWFLNNRTLTLTENQNKHLVLDPVSSQHAGNYSCAVKPHINISSNEKTLTVKALGKSMAIINVVRLTVTLLIPFPLLLFHLWMRWRTS